MAPKMGSEWLAVALGLGAGLTASLLVGLLSGMLVGYVGVSSILTTLGTMTLVTGACIVITGGSTDLALPGFDTLHRQRSFFRHSGPSHILSSVWRRVITRPESDRVRFPLIHAGN